MALNRTLILDTALDLLDKYGLADVTMRRVAGALDVAPGALYWHLSNKQELIAAMARSILTPVLDPESGREETPAVGDLLRSFRSAVLAHRDGADVVSAALSTPPLQAEMLERISAAVAAEGVDPSAALVLLHFGIGAAVSEQAARQLADDAGGEPVDEKAAAEAFDRGVATILAGAAR
ncbi:TetR family transcriptional regulator [Corynebacterium frankenforstense]